jgi:hypothetical protein
VGVGPLDTQPPWRMKGLAAALGDAMRDVLGPSRLAALIAYWEKRGELGPYPRDAHGHRRFVPADVEAIRARLTRWHRDDAAWRAKYRARPVQERERERTQRAARRHRFRGHAGPFDACADHLCAPYTPQAVARRATVDARVMAMADAEELAVGNEEAATTGRPPVTD